MPIAIEEVDLPFRYADIQTERLIGWDGSDSFPGYQKLVADITSNLDSPQIKLEEREQGEATKREAEKDKLRAVIHTGQVWLAILLTSTGWAITWIIGWNFGKFIGGPIIGWAMGGAIGGAIGGLVIVKALKQKSKTLSLNITVNVGLAAPVSWQILAVLIYMH